jgi:hypothetical protein
VIRPSSFSSLAVFVLLPGIALAQPASGNAAPSPQALQQQLDKLVDLLAQEESALKESQLRIDQLRNQVSALQAEVAGVQSSSPASDPPETTNEAIARLDSQVSALREQQDLQQSEIATHDQIKVESESRFPVKLTGLIVVNGFLNQSGVDVIQAPTVAVSGSGSGGFTLRQSVLGLDARGPHLFGADSSANLRVDFFGNLAQNSYSNGGVARLRTARAELAWNATRAFFALDRPILNPNAPASLTAIAQPALAWSGNLWNWIPQVGAEYSGGSGPGSHVVVQAAVADIPNPPPFNANAVTTPGVSLSERSRRPGSEARIGYSYGDKLTGLQVGLGGYFSPHRGDDFEFDAWAGTIDYRIPLTSHFELSGNVYRGAALGGLGAGAFKDYVWRPNDDTYHALDDTGGWAQLKARIGERFEFNGAYGLDNAFTHELRPYLTPAMGWYQNLARNATLTSNVIFSPTAYTLFSFEYRRIDSSPAAGTASMSDVYGVAAGYRF